MGESPTITEEQPVVAGSNRRLRLICILGLISLPLVLAARHYFFAASDISQFDRSPLPRPRLNAPFITTPDRVVEAMTDLAALTEDDLVYDLGCGDGRIVITAALRSGCRGVGFDIDPQRVAEARENAKLHGVKDRVTIIQQDIFQVDLSQADVAMMYLLPWMMNELVPQFERMKPGARIVAHGFWIDGVEPDQYVEIPVEGKTTTPGIYVYTTPLKKNATLEKGKPPRPSRTSSR